MPINHSRYSQVFRRIIQRTDSSFVIRSSSWAARSQQPPGLMPQPLIALAHSISLHLHLHLCLLVLRLLCPSLARPLARLLLQAVPTDPDAPALSAAGLVHTGEGGRLPRLIGAPGGKKTLPVSGIRQMVFAHSDCHNMLISCAQEFPLLNWRPHTNPSWH